jgi:hypothetical protein
MEQVSVKRPGIFELVTGTWRSIAGALIGLLPLLAVVAAALFGLNYGFPLLEQKLRVLRPASDSLFVLMAVPGAWVFGLEKLALGLAVAPAALVTMRRILADDGPHLAFGPLLRFWLWTAAVLTLLLGSLYLSGLAATPDLQLVSLVLKWGIALALPYLLLPIFPAVAAGEAANSVVARIDRALERWDGNFWRFSIVLLFSVGPVLLLLRVPAAIVQRAPGAASDAGQTFDASLIGTAIHAVLLMVAVVAGAAALAWCYNFSKLPKPKTKPLGT